MTATRPEDEMLVRALIFDGYVSDPHWVYRWRELEWGARGVAHFYGPEHPASSCRRVMSHILDRLEIEPALRDAWCAMHADELIVHEFRGEWPRSIPREVRRRRVFQVPVRSMWSLGLASEGVERVGTA
ncbi:MAG: hypothetical protein M8872_11160 [marine benthic group bacterium]|nr:hypothetical protein [Gemmatimonadota bacterium]